MTKFKTVFKYYLNAFDNKIGDVIENKVPISLFADSEKEALDRAKKHVSRKKYEVVEVQEIVDDTKR
ncbi:MAG TPA: hypothetical protein VD999_05830 [Vitreimonas sp.]|nr:hypothetical protein [Vitreimonas sp.]